MQRTGELSISTKRRTHFISITQLVVDFVTRERWSDGVLTVFVPHTTAGVTINENADPDVARDMEWFSDELIPQQNGFRHAEGNSDAHLKASFYGSSVQVIVRGDRLWLGTWQGLYFCEFDGPRQRKIYLSIVS